jgi:putative membrane protein
MLRANCPLAHSSLAMAPPDPAPNLAVELAKQRNRAAEERTLMAWIRTCLSLIGFGFGIERIVAVLHQSFGDTVNPVRLSRLLGLGFVALGTVAMVIASRDYRHQLQRIQRNELLYGPRHSPALMVAYVLTFLGSLAFLGMVLRP